MGTTRLAAATSRPTGSQILPARPHAGKSNAAAMLPGTSAASLSPLTTSKIRILRPSPTRIQIPAGMFSGSRFTLRGEFSSFHFDSATVAEAKGLRGTKRPRPGWGCEFWPQAQMTSPRDRV